MALGTLYIVATPIGNLGDITLRVVDTLRTVSVVLAEDTRVAAKLLAHLQLRKELISYHQHSRSGALRRVRELLAQGLDLALVTDAGTPGISDPGNELIAYLRPDIQGGLCRVVPIPGVSAVTAALSTSGFPADKFLFLGFPPHKNKRQKFFQEVVATKHTVVFYESCHRLKKCLGELAVALSPDREVCVARELTKMHESFYRGTIGEILAMDIPEKGEVVIVVAGV